MWVVGAKARRLGAQLPLNLTPCLAFHLPYDRGPVQAITLRCFNVG